MLKDLSFQYVFFIFFNLMIFFPIKTQICFIIYNFIRKYFFLWVVELQTEGEKPRIRPLFHRFFFPLADLFYYFYSIFDSRKFLHYSAILKNKSYSCSRAFTYFFSKHFYLPNCNLIFSQNGHLAMEAQVDLTGHQEFQS